VDIIFRTICIPNLPKIRLNDNTAANRGGVDHFFDRGAMPFTNGSLNISQWEGNEKSEGNSMN